MKTKKFKVLMIGYIFVDEIRLTTGIYESLICPSLHSADETIESMVQRAENVNKMARAHILPDMYFENLKQCRLQEVLLCDTSVESFDKAQLDALRKKFETDNANTDGFNNKIIFKTVSSIWEWITSNLLLLITKNLKLAEYFQKRYDETIEINQHLIFEKKKAQAVIEAAKAVTENFDEIKDTELSVLFRKELYNLKETVEEYEQNG